MARLVPRCSLVPCLLVPCLLWLGACASEGTDSPPVRRLSIDLASVDPAPVGIVQVAREEGSGRQFQIGAPLAADSTATVRYFWYYDYAADGPGPEFYSLCANSDVECVVRPCLRPNAQLDEHQVSVVVADAKLKPQAKHPLDFPPGTAYDLVQWTLKLTGKCLAAPP